jgi:PPM family protein phosphatase
LHLWCAPDGCWFGIFKGIRLGTLFSIISTITYILTSPFRFIGNALGLYRVQSQMQQISALRNAFRLPYPLNSLSSPFGKITFLDDIRERWQEWQEDRAYRRMAKDMPLAYQPETADFSQIHLTSGKQRVVLHIGATIHSSTAEVTLNENSQNPLHLTFRRVNETQYGAPFVLVVRGKCELAVDGRAYEPKAEIPIRHRSTLIIDEQPYRLELFAWQALPFAPRMEVGWYTDKGPVRHHNEDAIGMYKSPNGYCFAVADGVGGGANGELVSEFAIQYLLATFHANVRYKWDWQAVFKQAFSNINQEARRFGMNAQANAGTTLTAVVIKGWDAYVAHIGDSRLYLYSGGIVQQITQDHTRAVKTEADKNPNSQIPRQIARNVLQKAIGKSDSIEPQLVALRLQPGDSLILTSDAINTRVQPQEMAELVKTYRPNKFPQQLAQLANERYNADNVSVVQVQIQTIAKRTFWQPVASERVYANYNRAWSLRLDTPLALNTNYRLRQRRRTLWGWLVVLIVIAGLVGLAMWRNQQISQQSDTVQMPSPTVTITPSPSATPRPTLTATATHTPTATATRIPPTSTLEPAPTSTLADISQYTPLERKNAQ